jgi:protein pelota
MRLKHFELQNDGAFLSATVISVEGIWHLYNLIAVGDTIRTKTVRKVVREGAAGAGSTSLKRTFTLSLLVTAPPEYDAKGILRVSGKNQSQCDDVPLQAYHTSEIMYDPPQDFKLYKQEWSNLDSQRLREACAEETRADVAAVLMQNGSAQVVFINGSVMSTRAKVETAIGKKRKGSSAARDDSITKFFQQVLDMVLANIPADKMKVILFCSPGHVRDEFLNYMNFEAQHADAAPALKAFMQERQKFCGVRTSSGLRPALQEALLDPVVQQRMASARVASDIATFDAFQAMMARDPDRAMYGPDVVFAAMQDNAIDTLLLSDELLRSTNPTERHLFTEMAADVAEYGGTVQIFSSIGVASEQLRALTGVAAILRAPMPHLEEIEPSPQFIGSPEVADFLARRKQDGMTTTETYRTKSSD